MSAIEDTMAPLSKVDSAIAGLSSSPTEEKKMGHRRSSSSASGVFNVLDLEKSGTAIEIAPETQKLNWKMNTSPSTIDDKEYLKKMLTTPPVKKIDLKFPLGLEVTARNLKGVTVKDALDAIHKQFKKKQDDELELPYLAGFEWDKDESWTSFIVHQKKEGGVSHSSGKKAKKAAAKEAVAA